MKLMWKVYLPSLLEFKIYHWEFSGKERYRNQSFIDFNCRKHRTWREAFMWKVGYQTCTMGPLVATPRSFAHLTQFIYLVISLKKKALWIKSCLHFFLRMKFYTRQLLFFKCAAQMSKVCGHSHVKRSLRVKAIPSCLVLVKGDPPKLFSF